MRARHVAKAICGGLVAGLSYAIPVVDDGLTTGEGLGIVLALVVGFQTVYWVRNRD